MAAGTAGGLTAAQGASLALSAATAVTGISGAAANARAQKQALAILRKRVVPDHRWVGRFLSPVSTTLAAARRARALAGIFDSAGQLAEWETMFRERLGAKPRRPDDFYDPALVAPSGLAQFPALYLELASELAAAGNTNEAAACRQKSLALLEEIQTAQAGSPDLLTRIYFSAARSLREVGQPDAARGFLTKLIALEPRDGFLLNEVAWFLATCEDPEMRNATAAIRLARQAVAATSRTNAMYLDTLAAAYAEAGQFTNAVAVQKEAMAVAVLEGSPGQAGCASRLKLYEANTPYRERE